MYCARIVFFWRYAARMQCCAGKFARHFLPGKIFPAIPTALNVLNYLAVQGFETGEKL